MIQPLLYATHDENFQPTVILSSEQGFPFATCNRKLEKRAHTKSFQQLRRDPTQLAVEYVIKLLYIYSAAVAKRGVSACPNCLKP